MKQTYLFNRTYATVFHGKQLHTMESASQANAFALL